MARHTTNSEVAVSTAAAWIVGFIIFFPILWMILTSFKTELDAFATPPKFLFFHWTTENYGIVQERSDYFLHAMNSIVTAVGSTGRKSTCATMPRAAITRSTLPTSVAFPQ